ncbi:hypothetical protein [Lacticaseibacillus songhuajiangensis]|jgi:hypothetical protein|uniref:hypothetical protein n=1 Tax=Lacticaseibacillus songhuajiangensis TaxID=1296539 RepID=UPI000F7823B9|nr:hypothetical protein [Lacticaseibacillus songhuajiangensis]
MAEDDNKKFSDDEIIRQAQQLDNQLGDDDLQTDSNDLNSASTEQGKSLHEQGSAANDEALKEEIKKLKEQLAAQGAATSVASALRPTQKNWVMVLRFFQANPLMLFAVAWLAVILPGWWAFWLMVVYMLLCYVYPLTTHKTRFAWDERLERFLADPEVRRQQKDKQMARISNATNSVANEASGVMNSLHQKRVEKAAQQVPQQPNPAPTDQTAGVVKPVRRPLFTNNMELWLGLVVGVVSFIVSQQYGDGISDPVEQLKSIISSGTLSQDGYFYIWSFLGVRIGIMAVVGGLVKALMHKANTGAVLKALAVLAGVALAGIASYVYAHPVASAYNAARTAYDSGMSLDDLSTMTTLMQYLPFAIMGIYAVGIIVNLVGRNHESV